MNISAFKQLLASFVQRSPTIFEENGVDKLMLAANHAKSFAQRQLSFELARATVEVSVNKQDGGSLYQAKQLVTGAPVRVRTIERAFLEGTSGYYPVDVITRNSQIKRLARAIDRSNPDEVIVTTSYPLCVVRFGMNVFVDPWNDDIAGGEQMNVRMDVVQWMPDYSDTVVEDFFLVECQDWMLYRSLLELNIFLKEDQRVAIPDALAKESWESVRAWNESLISSQDDLHLD